MNTTTAPYAAAGREFERQQSAAIDGEEQSASVTDEPRHGASKVEALTRLLRWLGATVLAASAVAFLLQRWVGLDSIYRYAYFLGFTLLMSGAGIFCALVLREAKGARTFLGVAALFLPAHFAQLGALVYSLFIENPHTLFYDSNMYLRRLAIYEAPSVGVVLLTLVAALAFLVPITYAGISSMARSHAKPLTGLYFGLNALLLLPNRSPDVISVLVMLSFFGMCIYDAAVLNRTGQLRTWEGRAIRVMLFAPIAVLFSRTFLLYAATPLLYSALFAIVTTLLFFIIPSWLKEDEPRKFFQVIAVPPMVASWFYFIDGAVYNRGGILHPLFGELAHRLEIVALWLPAAAILSAMSLYAVGGGRGFRQLAAGVGIGASLLQLFSGAGFAASITCIMTALIVIAWAFALEERALFKFGAFGLAMGLLYHLRYASDLFAFSAWLSLAVIGSTTVIAASLLEKRYEHLVAWVNRFQKRLDEWD